MYKIAKLMILASMNVSIFSGANLYADIDSADSSAISDEFELLENEYQGIIREYYTNHQVRNLTENQPLIDLLSRVSALLTRTEYLQTSRTIASNVMINYRSLPTSQAEVTEFSGKLLILYASDSTNAGNIHTQLTFFSAAVLFNASVLKHCGGLRGNAVLLKEASQLYTHTIRLMDKLIFSESINPADKFRANTIRLLTSNNLASLSRSMRIRVLYECCTKNLLHSSFRR
ncbi:MAG: hypothetical protein AB8G05_19990 [Oligoflexales bacterium]